MRSHVKRGAGSAIMPKAKLYLQTQSGLGIFGNGKAQLLKSVAAVGSLRKAAALLKRNYRKAWGDINTAEKLLGRSLVCRTRGGPSGGTMELTLFGRSFLQAWERYERHIVKEINKAYITYFSDIITRN
ncbi:MAG: LysR family transcriptional regulator [Chitinispirillaceae bacterium]|nr:LysR family transcriptional regulator [Chitinispirillaceae bacterium]